MGRHRIRRPFSDAEIAVVWERWGEGVLYPHIARELQRATTSIVWLVMRHGGIAPPARRRSPKVLGLVEREEISRGLTAGESIRGIAQRLGRAPSTISREIHRHGDEASYRAAAADSEAWASARRPKECRLSIYPKLQSVVSEKLRNDWSPEQISSWLSKTYSADPEMQVSHETIYRTLFIQARGGLKADLVAHLRRSKGVRRSLSTKGKVDGRGQIPDLVPISERPPEAADRAVPGHWEGDLLAGNKKSNIATLVERKSRFVMLIKLPKRDTTTVRRALARKVKKLPASLKKSLAWDRGLEMSQHKAFTVATDIQVYFCDPHSPWQRGSNENTNGLLRQYFPKGIDLSNVTQRQLDVVANKLNTRPRKTLDWSTPAQVLAASVASTD